MSQQFLIHLSEIVLVAASSIGLVIIICASLYDIVVSFRQKRYTLLSAKLSKPRQPHVTIVVSTYNNAQTILSTLRSIHHSRYRNYDVLVIDELSTDETKEIIRDYQKQYPKRPLRLYAKRKSSELHETLKKLIDAKSQNNLVLHIDGATTLDPNTLRNSVVYLQASSKLDGVSLQVSTSTTLSLETISRQFWLSTSQLISKATSVFGFEVGTIHNPNMLFRVACLKSWNRTLYRRSRHLRFARVQQVNLVQTPRRPQPLLSTGIIVIISLLTIGLMTYWFYIAASLQSSTFFMLSWAAVSLWLLIVVMSDDSLRLTKKASLVFSIPASYFIIIVWFGITTVKRIYKLTLNI